MDFSQYISYHSVFNRDAESSYSRRIRNSQRETLYFINIHKYDLSDISSIPKPISYSGDVPIASISFNIMDTNGKFICATER